MMLWTAPPLGHLKCDSVVALTQVEDVKSCRDRRVGRFYELARTRRRNADRVDSEIGRTRLGHRTSKCVVTIGTRSAKCIMASGFTAAQTGRTHDRTRPMLQHVRKFLPRRRPHMTHSGHRPPPIALHQVGYQPLGPRVSVRYWRSVGLILNS